MTVWSEPELNSGRLRVVDPQTKLYLTKVSRWTGESYGTLEVVAEGF